MKTGGGHAGHNGLRSIHQHIGPDYNRVRLGIGHPGHKDHVAGYVLNDFARADQHWLDDLLRGISDGAVALAAGRYGPVPERRGVARCAATLVQDAEIRETTARTGPQSCRRRHSQSTAKTGGPFPVSVLAGAFATQAQACAALGSPFMARLCAILARPCWKTPSLKHVCRTGQAIRGPSGHSLPLRLAGALHALQLGGDAGLGAIYPPSAPDDAAFSAGIAQALETHATAINEFIDRPPQTNEVRRAAFIIAAASVVADRFGLPLRLFELGASAGLNLNFDRFRPVDQSLDPRRR